ncbi:MAG: hypothetical protein GEU95_25245 [Rhizobiales bacterium]|nr:hypothetical protein [Hyphomicrobiales bacterium]
MKKHAYFDSYDGPGWPDPTWLAPYFLTDAGRRRAFDYDNDSWGLGIDGLNGTEHLQQYRGRIDIRLRIFGNVNHGVLLCHQKFGPDGIDYYSIGDRGRLHEWVETMHGDLQPIGLFIPFEGAWKAVKEFMETDGTLPKSIKWIAVSDLPPGTFPGP